MKIFSILNKKNKAFTLVELLVVISIIGVLSSIVFASLGSARTKAKDAAIKSSITNMRAQAEILYDSNGCYTNSITPSCTGSPSANTGITATCALFSPTSYIYNILRDSQMNALCVSATSNSPSTMLKITEGVNRATYAISAMLNTTNTFFCIDSTGVAKETTDATGDRAISSATRLCK